MKKLLLHIVVAIAEFVFVFVLVAVYLLTPKEKKK